MEIPKGLKFDEESIKNYRNDMNQIDTDRRKLELWPELVKRFKLRIKCECAHSSNPKEKYTCLDHRILAKAAEIEKEGN